MYTVKLNVRNFQRCQQLLASYKQYGSSMSLLQLHKFVEWAERNTLRRACHFKPLQELMLKVTPLLLKDSFFTGSPAIISKATAIYCHLNLHNVQWMNRVASLTPHWLSTMQLNDISLIYKAFIELHNHEHTQFMGILRQTFLTQLLEATPTKNKMPSDLLRQVQVVHRYLRIYMLDPYSLKQGIAPIIHRLSDMFQQIRPAFNFKGYSYYQSAFLYELLMVFNVSKLISGEKYLHFLQSCFQQNQRIANEAVKQSSSKQFERRGESVFEIRFQRHLQENGYWFERNKKIGLHEFDIIMKGKLSQEHRPFADVNYDALKNGTASPIKKEQLIVFQKMRSLWVIEQQKKWAVDKIVNLNGPYHFIVGHSSGLIRSEQIKRDILKHYGYSDFIAIDYQHWERETTNQKGVRLFLQKHFGQ